MNPYSILADFLIMHIKPEDILQFKASEEVHDYFYSLLEKEKMGAATQEEIQLINEFMNVEHILRLAKAKVKQHAHQ